MSVPAAADPEPVSLPGASLQTVSNLDSGLCFLDKVARLRSSSISAAAHPSFLSGRVRVKRCQEAFCRGAGSTPPTASLQIRPRLHRSGPVSLPTRAADQPLGSFVTPTHLQISVCEQAICGANANIWSGSSQITRPLRVQ